ncbi:D-lyxose/D-mannose family sugar isomerase [Vibrio toranzoniae]|jgi:D-lyxose ketol-isomerase|uniref:D-lyxose/D-mannose family sugar isomerase n=1 Tax=Vibrio toranzoniae TaxID=1194427 RepID=UPI0013769EF9|nr:D-lyxose/D-mannose family sugar isomerase [Vibrio toranzoniae]NAZ93427.1 D-lyxose/D-mannose family sugar isomerase [Vibrio toranzoniae]
MDSIESISTDINNIIEKSGLFLKMEEIAALEITDFGLDKFREQGLVIHTYVNTERCCAKELIILPHQTCPEHTHPTAGKVEGKEETFRCRFGRVSIFISGQVTEKPTTSLPKDIENFSVFHEVVLEKGDQLTLSPDSKHWFKAHTDGAVLSEFSTNSNDETDIFTNPKIRRESRLF